MSEQGDLLEWWGFRLRVPMDYEPSPLGRLEVVGLALVFSTALELLWLLLLGLKAVSWSYTDPRAAFHVLVTVPVCLAVVLPVLGLILPPSLLGRTPIAALAVLGRERGGMGSWDRWMMLFGAVATGLAIWRLGVPLQLPAALLGGLVFASSFCLLVFLPAVDFSRRRGVATIPAWLSPSGSDDLNEKTVLVEQGAHPRLTFPVEGAQRHEVGVVIGSELIARLRAINAAHDGRLFNRELAAVVLTDRPPAADGEAQERVQALAWQLAAVGRLHGLTRFQLASQVLFLVQQAINYALDDDSTADFPGGPYQEYGRFALETLHDLVGDCECTTILAASLLSWLGFRVAVFTIRFDGVEGTSWHAALGLEGSDVFLGGQEPDLAWISDPENSSRRWLYGETAVDGGLVGFGVIPGDWGSTMTVERVEEVPPVRA